MSEPTFEAENKTLCPNTQGNHQWAWDDDQDSYFCDECGVREDNQEDEI